MALRVIGAGLGRTGTNSLKLALEQLLGGRCYHMFEAIQRDADTPVWLAAVRGEPVDWEDFMREYRATVDWPACSFWRELYAANPDALVLLSTRESSAAWRESMERTIVPRLDQPVPPDDPEMARRRAMILELMDARFTPGWRERERAIAAYERHNAEVRRSVPPERLIDWQPSQGWEPICAALGLDVPTEPFPRVNTSAEFRVSADLEEGQAA
jgi:Sulfotransferase domain